MDSKCHGTNHPSSGTAESLNQSFSYCDVQRSTVSTVLSLHSQGAWRNGKEQQKNKKNEFNKSLTRWMGSGLCCGFKHMLQRFMAQNGPIFQFSLEFPRHAIHETNDDAFVCRHFGKVLVQLVSRSWEASCTRVLCGKWSFEFETKAFTNQFDETGDG